MGLRYVMLAALAVSCSTAALAQTMNAEAFHLRAKKLMAKGPFAIFSKGEIGALMKEGQASGKAAAARNKALVAAGKPPRYCAPAKAKMSSDEYMAGLGAIPQAERRRIDMTEATTRIMARKYPCPR